MTFTAPITYYPNFVVNPDAALAALRDELDWERRSDAPRCEYYCNDFPKPYVYGRGQGERLYHPRPYHPVILRIRAALEALTFAAFEVCFLNRYLNQRDHLGWHADDSPEMDDDRPIGVVSLGVEREIWFRPKPMPAAKAEQLEPLEKLTLGHGSLCLMARDMQDLWQHRIPKASFVCGERISLTFRGYVVQP